MKLAYAQGRVVDVEKKSEHVALYLPSSMKVSLLLLAEKDRRKLSDYIRLVLEQHIADYAAGLEQGQVND